MTWNEVFADVAECVGRAYKDKSYPLRRYHDGMTSVLLWGVIATWSHDLHNAMMSSVSGASLSTPLMAKKALQAGFENSIAHMYAGTAVLGLCPHRRTTTSTGVLQLVWFIGLRRGASTRRSRP